MAVCVLMRILRLAGLEWEGNARADGWGRRGCVQMLDDDHLLCYPFLPCVPEVMWPLWHTLEQGMCVEWAVVVCEMSVVQAVLRCNDAGGSVATGNSVGSVDSSGVRVR
jgi:hypothetical protein